MSKGDETDRAIEKVLRNLVSKFIDMNQQNGLNQDLEQNNGATTKLTKAQRAEKKNQ